MTDKQFNDSFTAAGGWFILTQYETIANWQGSTTELTDKLFLLGFDAKRTGTNTRVSSVLRLIRENRIQEAIEKVRDSRRINQQHPEAYSMANALLVKYFQNQH